MIIVCRSLKIHPLKKLSLTAYLTFDFWDNLRSLVQVLHLNDPCGYPKQHPLLVCVCAYVNKIYMKAEFKTFLLSCYDIYFPCIHVLNRQYIHIYVQYDLRDMSNSPHNPFFGEDFSIMNFVSTSDFFKNSIMH